MEELTSVSSDSLLREIRALRAELAAAEGKLAEAQEVILAIQSGEVDAVVVSGPEGDRVFTLQGAEYAYRALVEAMNEGAATLSSDGTVLYCNQRLADLTQVPMEQIIGSPVGALVPEESKRLLEAVLARASSGEAWNTELDFRSGEGRVAPAHLSLRKMKSLEPTAICMVVTDLTERKRNDELIAAGRLATSILESAAEAIAVCDQAGRIVTANQALERLCGSNPLFQPFDLAIPLQVNDGSAQSPRYFSVAGTLQGATQRALEVFLYRDRRPPAYLLLTAAPIRSSSAVIGCVLTMTDITERKRAEEAIIRTEKLASVGRMASTIAHEINNPLETIGQSVYLAMTDPSISQEAKSYLEIAVAQLERVAHITTQTLAFHRDQSTPQNLDLGELADNILRLFSARLAARGVTVEKRYAQVEPIKAFGGEIRQVISNLISNSMDAVPDHGRIHLRVARSSGKDGARWVRFVIADTGSGILPERLSRIFEPFFTTKEMVGVGLGLWVTKQIIEKYGGLIRVRSKPGAGTVFAVVFPAAEGGAEAHERHHPGC